MRGAGAGGAGLAAVWQTPPGTAVAAAALPALRANSPRVARPHSLRLAATGAFASHCGADPAWMGRGDACGRAVGGAARPGVIWQSKQPTLHLSGAAASARPPGAAREAVGAATHPGRRRCDV